MFTEELRESLETETEMTAFQQDMAVVIGMAESGPEKLQLPFFFDRQLLDEPLELCRLSMRAVHTLQRERIVTIGELFDNMERLSKIRNCGAVTVKEIKNIVADFLYGKMTPEQKKKFWKEFIELNDIKGVVAK